MPREPLDTREYLSKHAARQVAFGQLEGVVAGMPDNAPAELIKRKIRQHVPDRGGLKQLLAYVSLLGP